MLNINMFLSHHCPTRPEIHLFEIPLIPRRSCDPNGLDVRCQLPWKTTDVDSWFRNSCFSKKPKAYSNVFPKCDKQMLFFLFVFWIKVCFKVRLGPMTPPEWWENWRWSAAPWCLQAAPRCFVTPWPMPGPWLMNICENTIENTFVLYTIVDAKLVVHGKHPNCSFCIAVSRFWPLRWCSNHVTERAQLAMLYATGGALEYLWRSLKLLCLKHFSWAFPFLSPKSTTHVF